MIPARRFGNLLGHARTLLALSRALDEDRLSPALLLHGPAGVGKLTAALELARELLCLSGSGPACGRCDSCRRVSASALLHPDVGLLFPQKKEDASEKVEDDTPGGALDLQAIQEETRKNPTWRILAEPARERLSRLFLSPSGGKRRLLLVLAAERLNEEAGNALLKVLEEPPRSATLLLLCENPAVLLPTLRSRCQAYRFGSLSRKDLALFLDRDPALPRDQAALIASLSGGRIGRARSLAQDVEDYRGRRAHLARILSRAREQGSAAAALAAAAGVLSLKADLQEELSILADFLRDGMLSGCGCNPGLLTDPAPATGEAPALFTPRQAAALLVRLEKAREDLRRFVNRQVAVESLFLDLVNPPTALRLIE